MQRTIEDTASDELLTAMQSNLIAFILPMAAQTAAPFKQRPMLSGSIRVFRFPCSTASFPLSWNPRV